MRKFTSRLNLNERKPLLITAIISAFILFVSCSGDNAYEMRELTEFVNPYIGADRTSNNSLSPQMPWGSVQPQPDTDVGNFAGYLDDHPIRGFSQLRITGGGGAAGYGNFLISPQIGLAVEEEGHDSPKSEEKPTCTSYSVKLDRYDIKAELTPSHHAAIYRFTFPESNNAHILVDLGHMLSRDGGSRPGNPETGLQEGSVTVDDENQTMKGWGIYDGGYHAPYKIFFYARFSQAPVAWGTWRNGEIKENSVSQDGVNRGDRIGGYFKFNTNTEKPVLVKIAVSFRNMENAEKFVDQEIAGFDFEQVEKNCKNAWNKHLSTFLVDDHNITQEQKTIFYTAVWRASHQPHDRTGDSPIWDTNDPYWDDHFCTWDSWRTLFPLWTLAKESFTRSNLHSYIKRFENGRWVGDVILSGHDEGLGSGQGGEVVDNVIADAYVKNVKEVDWEKAYQIMKNHAENGRIVHGDRSYHKQYWIPYYTFTASSKTLEYAYQDFSITQVAKGLGKQDDYNKYIKRTGGWEALWNPDLESRGFKGFMSGKDANGSWVPFDPLEQYTKEIQGKKYRIFYEEEGWIYSFYVPHDIARIVTLMGGPERFKERLSYGLKPKPDLNNQRLLEASNEPGFWLAMLFHYAGHPELSSAYIRDFELPDFTMENYGGQEDQGALSARYIWLISGLYPIAGQDVYLLYGPRYQKLTIQLDNGKKLEIIGKKASKENKYVQSLSLNGKLWEKNWLRHNDIRNGGTLEFEMGPEPSTWGQNEEFPPSLSTGGFK